MAKTKGKQEEIRDYADEIGLGAVPLSIAKQVVQLSWHDGHVPLLIGESSTGKTHGINQLAELNGMDMLPFHLGNVDSSNIRGPAFPQPDGTFKYLPPGHIPIKWEPSTRQRRILHRLKTQDITLDDVLSPDFDSSSLEGFSDKDLDVIFEIRANHEKEQRRATLFFDELNRGSKDAMNAVMSVWTERLLGGAKLGPNVRIVAAMNPPGGAYSVNNQISTDPAMRRRLCQVVVHFSQSEFLRYMSGPKAQTESGHIPPIDYEEIHQRDKYRPWHPAVVSFLRQTPKAQLDYVSRESGKVYPCPATWEAVSDTMYTVERLELDLDNAIIARVVKTKVAGHINQRTASDFLNHYRTQAAVIDPVEVLYEYKPKTPVWGKIQKKLHASEYLSIMNVLEASIRHLIEPEKRDFELKDVVPQLGHLFNDLPANCAQDLLVHISSVATEIHGGYHEDLRDLMNLLVKDPNFKAFQTRSLQMAKDHQEAQAKESTP